MKKGFCILAIVVLLLVISTILAGATPILTEGDEVPEYAIKLRVNETWFYFDVSPYMDNEVRWVEIPISTSALVEGENWIMWDSTIENVDNQVMSVDLFLATTANVSVLNAENAFMRAGEYDSDLQVLSGAWAVRLLLTRGEQVEEIIYDEEKFGNACVIGYYVPTGYAFYPVQRFLVSDVDSLDEVRIQALIHVSDDLWTIGF
jgi:hypothetical protein